VQISPEPTEVSAPQQSSRTVKLIGSRGKKLNTGPRDIQCCGTKLIASVAIAGAGEKPEISEVRAMVEAIVRRSPPHLVCRLAVGVGLPPTRNMLLILSLRERNQGAASGGTLSL